MNMNAWGKTLLTVQKYLERVTKAIDSLIFKRALSSGYVSTRNITEQSAYSVSQNIIGLSERKINLININTICFNALKGIDKISAKILILKFIDGFQSSEIAELLGISDRTYYRKLNLAYSELGVWLSKNNFSDRYFKEKYKNEGWILDVYNKNKSDINKKDEYINEDVIKNAIKGLNKFKCREEMDF